MEKYFTGSNILTAALVVLALAWAYNLVCTARDNARKEKERAEAPLNALKGDVATIRTDIANDRERITALERDLEGHADELRDLHAGQSALCRGVQALLEFNLHNGNENEMRAASDSIGKWLRTR